MAGAPKTYVALLRGINVGGKAKVDMPTLREVFEAQGFADVKTYINSGNVLFRDKRQPRTIVTRAEAAIADRFGFPVDVVLRDHDALRRLCKAIPAEWTNDKDQRTDVLFLQDDVDKPGLLDSIAFDPEIEQVLHRHGALVWNISRKNQPRGKLVKLVGTDVYRRMTIRNVNTVRKLRELMEAMG